jgi:uracil phosphoribosyltransferase
MKIHLIGKENSLLLHYLAEIRDRSIQKDRMRFRRNIERIGEILSYELSKELNYKSVCVKTPLGEKETASLKDEIVICSVLRAGLPLHLGVLNYFDHADNAFISAFRKKNAETDELEIQMEYLAAPDLQGKTLLLVDPMLATGMSLTAVFEALKRKGHPREIHIIVTIASQSGIDYLENMLPENTHLWIADIDPVLNENAYIVPGLGDAGDLAFGPRL